MATIKITLDKRRELGNGTMPVKISVAHHGQTFFVALNIYVLPSQFQPRAEYGIYIKGHPQEKQFNAIIKDKLNSAQETLIRLEREKETAYTAKQIRDAIAKDLEPKEEKPFTVQEQYLNSQKNRTKERTANIYSSTWKKIEDFCNNEGIDPSLLRFEDIDKQWLQSFERYLSQHDVPKVNARAIHLRNLRALFNDALDVEKIQCYPFRTFKIKHEETIKRSLTKDELSMLFTMEVEPYQERYRDIFMLSFLLLGINMVDMIHLKKTDIEGNRIHYRREKTNKLYDIKIEPEAQVLIEKYLGAGEYLLNIKDSVKTYTSFTSRINKELKLLGSRRFTKDKNNELRKRTALFPKLSTYWARHSWATIASELDIPKEVISEGLGHTIGSPITSIYINFNRKKVDEANRKIIDFILYK